MFKKILIANRGEIACRVIKTAQKMGVATVAVYSDADRDARHVAMADEAVAIGAAPASESYLVGEKIIEAALSTGAEAIHPGYGFLSENVKFMRQVEKAGLVFIGPGARAIESMGDKLASKRLAGDAGVSIVPGHIGEISDAKHAVAIAKKIGFPVMIKASAGGGGKGMRVAWNANEAAEGFQSARNEAISSFADDRILIEKFIEQPRHIEIQIIADKAGNTLYLGERECSIQRRHQKVIEEAPSPFIDEETRKKMGEQAVALAKAVGYYSAGTVEFIVDKDRNFYFLEMNTRLQVEHPITEKITGLDLVELMLRVAFGETLNLTQTDVKLKGWAIESRVYAEDPYRNFLPSIGRLTHYIPPEETANVRVDTGVTNGSEISMFYDPMIAKLVTYGENREAALAEMRQALDAYYIRGVGNNIHFLSTVMNHPKMIKGQITTNFITEEFPEGFLGGDFTAELRRVMIAVATFIRLVYTARAERISGQMAGVGDAMRPNDWVAVVEGKHIAVTSSPTAKGAHIYFEDKIVEIESDWVPGNPLFEGIVGGKRRFIEIDNPLETCVLTLQGVSKAIKVLQPHIAELSKLMPPKKVKDTSKLLLCPMPGLVINIGVKEGDDVKAGQTLAIIEAMKMENTLKAERDGTVSKVCVAEGDSLAVDAIIMEFA